MIESGILRIGGFFLELELVLLIALVLTAAIFDLISRRIPNWLIVAGLGISFFFQTVSGYGTGFSTWATGFGVGFALFLPMYILRAMGAGDVKLMAMVGSFFGAVAALKAVLLTLIVGGVLAVLYLLGTRRWKVVFENLRLILTNMTMNVMTGELPVAEMPAQSAGGLPYGVAIATGTLLYIFFPSLMLF